MTDPTTPLDSLSAQAQGDDEAAAVAVLRGEVTTMSDPLTAHLNAHATAGNCVWPSGMPVDTYGGKLRLFMNRDRPLPPGWTVDALNPMTPGALLLMLEDLHPGAVVWMEPGDRMDPAASWDVWASYPGARSEYLGGGMDRPAALTAAILAVPL